MARTSRTQSTSRAVQEPLPELPLPEDQASWDKAKLWLRAIGTVFATALAAVLISLNFAQAQDRYAMVNYSWIAVGSCLLWNTIEFVVTCATPGQRRRGQKPNHPKGIPAAWHLAADLILWMVTLGVLVFQSLFIVFRNRDHYAFTYYIAITDANAVLIGLDFSHLSFVAVLFIIHFALFVRACVEVDRRNKDLRMQRLILAMQRQGTIANVHQINQQLRLQQPFQQQEEVQQSPSPRHHLAGPAPGYYDGTDRGSSSNADSTRDFTPKYDHVPEMHVLLPEDERNMKVLISDLRR